MKYCYESFFSDIENNQYNKYNSYSRVQIGFTSQLTVYIASMGAQNTSQFTRKCYRSLLLHRPHNQENRSVYIQPLRMPLSWVMQLTVCTFRIMWFLSWGLK